MDLSGKNIGFAMCGSFCTFKKAFEALKSLKDTNANIIPIMSAVSAFTNTRFGEASDFREKAEKITGNNIIITVHDAEPIGPKRLLDLLVILPCTGNTLAKAAMGIADTSVTMAMKAHLRNERPVLIGISTNDGLGSAAKKIGTLMNRKNIYFIPFAQDDYIKKPNSLVADFDKLVPAAEAAMEGKQLQPVIG